MAAAACGPVAGAGANTAKTAHKEVRKSKDSRRRQAALLFLNNISLDGRPVCALSNGSATLREAGQQGVEAGVPATAPPLSSAGSHGAFSQLSAPVSNVVTLPRTNTYPPVSLHTTLASFNQGSSEVLSEEGKVDPLSSQGFPFSSTSGPTNPNLASSKYPAVTSTYNFTPLDPRQRWVFVPDRCFARFLGVNVAKSSRCSPPGRNLRPPFRGEVEKCEICRPVGDVTHSFVFLGVTLKAQRVLICRLVWYCSKFQGSCQVQPSRWAHLFLTNRLKRCRFSIQNHHKSSYCQTPPF